MPELENALLLHPINKISIDLRVATKEILLHFGILDHDIFPRLRVGAGHRPPARFQDPVDVFFRNRIRLEFADTRSATNNIIEKLVARRCLYTHDSPPLSNRKVWPAP